MLSSSNWLHDFAPNGKGEVLMMCIGRVRSLVQSHWPNGPIAILGGFYAWNYATAVGRVEEGDLATRVAANSLLLDTIGLAVTAVSILLPATVGIYFYLAHDKSYPGHVSRFFFWAAIWFVLSLLLGIYTAFDLHVRTHDADRLLLSTSPFFNAPAALQFYSCLAGVGLMLFGAMSYQSFGRRPVEKSNSKG